MNPGVEAMTEIYYNLPLDVDGVSGRSIDAESFPRLPAVLWFLTPGHGTETSTADLYLTKFTDLRLTYANRQIDGNIAVIRWSAGRYPIWVQYESVQPPKPPQSQSRPPARVQTMTAVATIEIAADTCETSQGRLENGARLPSNRFAAGFASQ